MLKSSDIQVEMIKDNEIAPDTRRAKIVMQTCAHVSGAAYFYDPKKYCSNLNIPVKSNDPESRKVTFFTKIDIFE